MDRKEMIDWLLSVWTTVVTMMNAKDDKKGRRIRKNLESEGWKPSVRIGDWFKKLDDDAIEDIVDFLQFCGVKKPTGPYGNLNPDNRKLIDTFDEKMLELGIQKFIDEKYPEFLDIVLGRGNSVYPSGGAWVEAIRTSAMTRLVKSQKKSSEKEEKE